MRFNIQAKLLITTIIPVIALLIFSLMHAQTQVLKIEQFRSVQKAIKATDTINHLMHEIQLERGLSTLYYFDKSKQRSFLQKQRAMTEQNMIIVVVLLNALKSSNDLKSSQKSLKNLITDLERLNSIRAQINNREITFDNFFSYYSNINNDLNTIIQSLPIYNANHELYFKATTFFNTILLEEAFGKERAVITKISLQKSLLKEDNFKFLQIQEDIKIHIENILKQNYYYSEELKTEFTDFLQSPLQEELLLYLKPIIEYKMKLFLLHIDENVDVEKIYTLRHSLENLDTVSWLEISTSLINRLHNYDQKLYTELMNSLLEQISKEETSLKNQLLLTFLVVGFLLLFNRFLSLNIIKSLLLLKEGTHNFFTYLNHQTQSADKIKINSNDEFSDMADEINNEIENLQKKFDNDKAFILEITHIADLMSEGDFSEKIYFDANNPNLAKLKEVFNNLLRMIQQKIDAQNDEMQMINNSLETQVYEQTLTLEENLKELSAFKLAIDESLMFMQVDIEKGILEINDAMLQTFMYPKEQMLGRVPDDFLSKSNYKNTREEILNVVTKGDIYHGQIAWLDKNGEEFFTDAHIIPIFKRSGEINYILALFHDITPIIHARDKAIRAEKSKDEFLSNMSHEIRTPLNAILGFVSILQKRALDEKSLHYLEIINSSSNSLLGIINDILDFSKIQSGKFVIEERVFSPIQIISNSVLLFASKAYEKEITLLSYIDPNMPPALLGDEIRIKQVLSNFLSNALKFSPSGSSVRLRAVYHDGEFRVSIKDEGVGIDLKDQKRIFKAFEQADGSTTRKYGGTGLGLSISAHLVELMHGKIALKSALNQGSTFSFSLEIPTSDELNAQETHIEKIKHLRIALLKDEKNSAMSDLIEKYFKDYGVVNISYYDSLENLDTDLLIFVSNAQINAHVQALNIPSIALNISPTHIFDASAHIYNLNAPFTPKLVLEALDDATIERLRVDDAIECVEEELHFTAHVLIAEDNKTNQMLISLLLEDYGISFDIADDGDIAVEMIKKDVHYDLILMDENMPKLNGISAMKLIKTYLAESEKKIIPVVALTANAMQGDRERFIREGMDDFITKPIETTELERVFLKFLQEEKAT